MSIEDSQRESFYTPRAQKCLFASGINSCKKYKDTEASSEEESDLGPMSPLALTDRSPSTCDSSPSREFISPLLNRSSLSRIESLSQDCLKSNLDRRPEGLSPFSSLKKLTRAARYSPRCKLFANTSSNALLSSPDKSTTELLNPKRSKMNIMADKVIPETPQRTFATEIQNYHAITETPRKSRSPENRLITPLGSITKTALLPKIHRRKSSNTFEKKTENSPEQKENTLKRHARDQLAINPAKLFKADDSVPKARTALFQERNEFNSKDFTLSTKSFYSGFEKHERPFVIKSFRNNDMKKRRSLPVLNGNSGSKRSLKKQRFGKINAGVFHGIKKPKRKINLEILKKEGQVTNKSPHTDEDQSIMEVNPTAGRASSPEIDENKRFFKTNKTIRTSQVATVTVNKKIKLKVTDGKIVLNKKRVSSSANMYKQEAKATNVTFDTTDLAVDEPEVEATLEQDKVANILKMLEDDWAIDDYDTMGGLTVSPSKPMISHQDVIMSPATELSNLTSTMNIRDVTSSTNFENLSLNDTKKNDKEKANIENDKENNKEKANTENDKEKANTEEISKQKYFPLFNKGYSTSNNIFEETDTIKSSNKAVKKNMQWQLSMNGGGGEDQYQLDVGQKRFGATQCPECNVVYQLGDPEDENAHLNYHNSIRILKFQGWKTERVIMEDSFTSSRIILIEPHDSKQCWKKVSEILTVVDRDLGLTDMQMSDYQNKKVFLYIREKNVLGVLVAEHIKTAYRMIPELIELNCCTAESTPTKCGINVVWTAMSHRRQGIATKLVDILRAKFFYGYVMSLDDIAFSTPSPSGKIFAEKYTKTRNFKVYS